MKIVDEERPRDWQGFQGQEKIVEDSKRWLERGEFPDIICVGPPGSGKTTWIRIFASKFFSYEDNDGKNIIYNIWELEHPDFLVLNASDARGIDVVRGRIKEFAGALPTTAPFRILVLEEGDQLTKDAQDALRATIEDNSDTCRFFFSGNDESYIDAIKSRCAILRFTAVPDKIAAKFFQKVAKKHGVIVPDEISMKIAEHYEGDLRIMFNDCLEKLIGIDHEVGEKDLDFGSSILEIATIILAATKTGENPRDGYYKARIEFTKAHAKYKFNIRQFLKTLHEMIGPMSFELAEKFAEIDMNIAQGGLKDIQIGALLARLAQCLSKSK